MWEWSGWEWRDWRGFTTYIEIDSSCEIDNDFGTNYVNLTITPENWISEKIENSNTITADISPRFRRSICAPAGEGDTPSSIPVVDCFFCVACLSGLRWEFFVCGSVSAFSTRSCSKACACVRTLLYDKRRERPEDNIMRTSAWKHCRRARRRAKLAMQRQARRAWRQWSGGFQHSNHTWQDVTFQDVA